MLLAAPREGVLLGTQVEKLAEGWVGWQCLSVALHSPSPKSSLYAAKR